MRPFEVPFKRLLLRSLVPLKYFSGILMTQKGHKFLEKQSYCIIQVRIWGAFSNITIQYKMLWQYQWKNISWESLYEPAKIILGISGHLQSFIRCIKRVGNFIVLEFLNLKWRVVCSIVPKPIKPCYFSHNQSQLYPMAEN